MMEASYDLSRSRQEVSMTCSDRSQKTGVSGFGGEDGGVVRLDVAPQVDTVLRHGWLVRTFQTDMLLVLLQPSVNRTAHLPNVDLTALIGDAVYSRRLQSQVILH
jgi:hypothetical protein